MKLTGRCLIRALVGGLLAAGALWLLCFAIAAIDIFGGAPSLGDILCRMALAPDQAIRVFGETGAAAWQLGTVFLLGAAAGLSTLPMEETWTQTPVLSILHFFLTGALALAAGWFEPGPAAAAILFVLLYGLIAFGRWLSWWSEAAAIREKLGITPAPSPLRWRESLPHVLFALLTGAVVPAALALLDAVVVVDAAVFSQLLYPWLILPVVALCVGLSLGRRQGFCPLYPAACLLFTLGGCLLWGGAPAACLAAAIPALLGVSFGAARRKKGACHEKTDPTL